VDAEMAARVRSDALIATLREHLDGEVSRSAVRVALAQYDEALKGVTAPHPGAQLLAVVEALRLIDKHVVGAYETESGSVEPCDECGEMREIAAQSLASYEKALKGITSG